MSIQHASMPNILGRLAGQREGSFPDLVDSVYADLRGMAERRIRHRFGPNVAGVTIQPTMLANDTVMELLRQRASFESREHFFAIATRLMLRLLSNYHREREALRRGGGDRGVSLDDVGTIDAETLSLELEPAAQRIAEVIERLHEASPRCAEVATLRLFGEHQLPQIARMIDVSIPTVERDWRFAKAYLKTELGEEFAP
ncbi:MAG: ECF-type sigma factor [Phycisphaerales bacterium]